MIGAVVGCVAAGFVFGLLAGCVIGQEGADNAKARTKRQADRLRLALRIERDRADRWKFRAEVAERKAEAAEFWVPYVPPVESSEGQWA